MQINLQYLKRLFPHTWLFEHDQEIEYRQEYAISSLRQVRAGAILGLLMIDLFYLYDFAFMPADNISSYFWVRFGFLTPVILIWFWSSFKPWFPRWMQQITTVILILVGMGYVMIGLLAPPEATLANFGGTILLTIFIYTAAKLWMAYAMIAGWSVVLLHLIGFGYWGEMSASVLTEGIFFLTAANLLGMIGAYQLERSKRKDFAQVKEIEYERNRSEELLLNILPAPIADRLKSHEKSIADGFEEVTILFVDIVSFTELSSSMEPRELVVLLNSLFTKFDDISGQYGLEKIKTIGDAYMAVAGLPDPNPDHAASVARAALAMRDAAPSYAGPDDQPIAVRIGIHTGPVVAGVIGSRKFIYDLWGDAVNIASRMETHGLPSAIQVSAATRAILAETFEFTPRGTIDVKGKGQLEAFLLTGEKENAPGR